MRALRYARVNLSSSTFARMQFPAFFGQLREGNGIQGWAFTRASRARMFPVFLFLQLLSCLFSNLLIFLSFSFPSYFRIPFVLILFYVKRIRKEEVRKGVRKIRKKKEDSSKKRPTSKSLSFFVFQDSSASAGRRKKDQGLWSCTFREGGSLRRGLQAAAGL